ncbi:hypothetical protein BC834DRAFT_333560 [Gloeopeniophorella convolvens]|nr:hypothetical protein BC834DRAFT_333560 [Gloeopeniophorella convolvens]
MRLHTTPHRTPTPFSLSSRANRRINCSGNRPLRPGTGSSNPRARRVAPTRFGALASAGASARQKHPRRPALSRYNYAHHDRRARAPRECGAAFVLSRRSPRWRAAASRAYLRLTGPVRPGTLTPRGGRLFFRNTRRGSSCRPVREGRRAIDQRRANRNAARRRSYAPGPTCAQSLRCASLNGDGWLDAAARVGASSRAPAESDRRAGRAFLGCPLYPPR